MKDSRNQDEMDTILEEMSPVWNHIELVDKLTLLQKTLNEAIASSLAKDTYNVLNEYGQTRIEYQKWLRSEVGRWLRASDWSLGQRVVMAHLWSKIDHKFDLKPQFWMEGDNPSDLNEYHFIFRQSDLAEELGMTNKGMREILEQLSGTDALVQKHPYKAFHWIFNGEAISRSYEK